MLIPFLPRPLRLLALLLLLLPLARPARADADADADLAAKLGFKLIRLTQRGETTAFLVAGTPAQLRPRKPVVVLCQGAEVRPLFAVYAEGPFLSVGRWT